MFISTSKITVHIGIKVSVHTMYKPTTHVLKVYNSYSNNAHVNAMFIFTWAAYCMQCLYFYHMSYILFDIWQVNGAHALKYEKQVTCS